MNNIITSSEAFQAIHAGKTVLCRHITGEFEALDQFPATVFAMQNYEFCIKIETMELAGITFTKPLTLDEYQDDQEVFVLSTFAPSIYIVNSKTAALVESINAGFVQRDAENAKLQLMALTKSLGREIEGDVSVTRLGAEPKKSKRKNKDAENKITTIDGEVEQAIAESQDTNQISEHASEDKCELTIDAIGTCKTIEETENFISCISETDFSSDQWERISKAKADKLSELQYQTDLNEYLAQVEKAQSPAEANSVFGKTTHWTDEQRKPLHAAVSRRLAELPQPVVKDPPSLLVRIQRAANLDELAELEIEVSTRDAQIVPALMSEVKKRRAQIDQFNPSFVEDLP